MRVLFLSAADTKAAAITLVRRRLERAHDVSFIDIGCLTATKDATHLYTWLGKDPTALFKLQRGEAVRTITKVLKENAARIIAAERADVIVGLGGGGGSSILIEAIARNTDLLPPLILLSTVWRHLRRTWFERYTVIVPALVDLDIINAFSRVELAHFARLIDSFRIMAETDRVDTAPASRKYVVTTLGSLNRALRHLTALASPAEFIAVHANGASDVIPEILKRTKISALVLLAGSEFANFLYGGDFCSRNPFDILRDAAVPVVLVPGGMEFVVTLNREPADGTLVARTCRWNEITTLSELKPQAAEAIGERLRTYFPAGGKNRIVLPLRSYSELSEDGQPFARSDFVARLNQTLIGDESLAVVAVDADVNSPEFALAIRSLLE